MITYKSRTSVFVYNGSPSGRIQCVGTIEQDGDQWVYRPKGAKTLPTDKRYPSVEAVKAALETV